MKWLKDQAFLIFVAIVTIAWIITVTLSGRNVNLFNVKWNFQTTALLGDSFGVLSSGMAALAAYFAFATYRSAKDEAKILARRAAEPSFLNLLERRFQMMENVMRVSSGVVADGARMNVLRGQIALDWAAQELWNLLSKTEEFEERKRLYNDFIAESVAGLTNYHRYTFHIIAYAERQFAEIADSKPMTKFDPSYSYIQLLRAQFSDAEMLLIAFNALFGAGYPKLKRYIERYALLNNMPEVDIGEFAFDSVFDPTAFGLLVNDRPKIVMEPRKKFE